MGGGKWVTVCTEVHSAHIPVHQMPNKSRGRVRKSREIDPRIARSTHALGRALVELLQERDFADITVQSILDRAGVGRATFYAHYRNKEDVLHSAYERVFVRMEQEVERPLRGAPLQARLFPVAEFAAHVADARPVLDAMRASGRMHELWSLGLDYASRIIEKQLRARAKAERSRTQHALAARMLAGAMIESIQWWLDHPSESSPQQLDAAFHQLAHKS